MSDVEQRIELLDGFTEPLNDLKDSIKDVLMQNDLLTESVKQGNKEFSRFGSNIKSVIGGIRSRSLGLSDVLDARREIVTITRPFVWGFKEAGKTFNKYKGTMAVTFSEQIKTMKNISKGVTGLAAFSALKLKGIGTATKGIFKGFSFSKNGFASIAKKIIASLKGLGLKVFTSVKTFLPKLKATVTNFIKGFSFSKLIDAIKKLKTMIVNFIKGFSFSKVISSVKNGIGGVSQKFSELGKTVKDVKDTVKTVAPDMAKSFAGGFAKALKGPLINAAVKNVNAASTKLFKSTLNAYHNMFRKLFDTIEPYIDRLEEADKMTAMFGASKAESFNNKMYMWAQQHGQNARVVSQLGSKAAYEGIGTKHFDKLMTFADKIATLSPGKTFEDTASSLIENIKHGHDAGTISQMLGGGQMMERQLRWKGYERALRRGDIDKALEIAEKVAEQAGITDDKYKEAGESMAKNFTAIQNIVDNIKSRFFTEFNKQFAPSIKRIRDFLESEGFQKFINGMTTIIRLVGKGFNKAIEFCIDNINILGILLGVAVGTKVFMIVKSMKTWIGLGKTLLPVIKFLLGPLGKILGGMVHLIKTLGISKALIRAIGASLKRSFVTPIVIAAAVIGGILFAVHKISGIAETFPSFLAGFGTFLQNAFENLLIMLENVGKFILSIPTRIKMIGPMIRALVMKFIGWLGDKLKGLGLDDMGQMFKDVSDVGTTEAERDRLKYQKDLEKFSPREFIDSMRGVNKAMDETKTWGDLFKRSGITGLLEKIDKKLGLSLGIGDEISTDTSKIRESMDQEEELKWLKAFSDRQIGSAYNSMTSSTVNTTINGASQQVIMNLGRRDPKSVSPRAKKYA